MRTYYEGPTYTVAFDENDTGCFAHHTDAPAAVVHGAGAFVFDTRTGELLDAHGAAKGRTEMEWLAFSQDAQDFARLELSHHGVAINPFDFGCDLPEVGNPAKARKAKGGTPEIGRTVILERAGQTTRHNPGDKAFIANVDDDGDVWVLWEDGDWSVLADDDQWEMPASYNPDDLRVTRTRGSKTPGPYSAKRGYKSWIGQRSKLGDGFLTTMTKQERHDALDRCVQAHNYRSCLGSIMVLERAHRGPHGNGEGVGVRYAQQLAESRAYLREKYGGAASAERQANPRDPKKPSGRFALVRIIGMDEQVLSVHKERSLADKAMRKQGGDPVGTTGDRSLHIVDLDGAELIPRIQGGWSTRPTSARSRTANPEASVHRERMENYIHESGTALRDAKAAADGGSMPAALRFIDDAKRYIVLAEHEAKDAELDDSERDEIAETIELINESLSAFFLPRKGARS